MTDGLEQAAADQPGEDENPPRRGAEPSGGRDGSENDSSEDEHDIEPLKELILEEVKRRFGAAAGGSLQVVIGRDFLANTIGNGPVTGAARVQSIALGSDVPKSRIETIRNTYVLPGSFLDLKARLDEHRLLILRARPGWGGTATAVRLLCDDHARIQQISEVDGRLSALHLDDLERETGLVVENLTPEQLLELASGQAERLASRLERLDSRAVIVVDEASRGPDYRIERYTAALDAHPSPLNLVESHLTERLGSAELARDVLAMGDVAEWIAGTPIDERFDAHLLVSLADDLAEVAQGNGIVAEVRENFEQRSESDIDTWFDEIVNDKPTTVPALTLTLAVLEGLPYGTISRVSTSLEQVLTEDTPESAGKRRLRRVHRTQLLKTVRARLTTQRRSGRFRHETEVVSFLDERYRRRVLDLVYEYGFENQLLPWLSDLTGDRDVAVAVRAAEVVGYLGKFDFARIRGEFIGPWARSPRPYDRELAVVALSALARDAKSLTAVTQLVREWSRKKLGPLRRTAARALGASIGPLMPSGPDDLLDELAEGAARGLAKAIGFSFAELFALADMQRRVELLQKLSDWAEEPASWRGTAGLAGFVECGRIRVSLSFNGERVRWPLLLVLSSFNSAFERDPVGGWHHDATGRIRYLTSVLIANAAGDLFLLPEFEGMLHGWESDTEQHPMLKHELDELLKDAAEAPGGGRNVEFYRKELLK